MLLQRWRTHIERHQSGANAALAVSVALSLLGYFLFHTYAGLFVDFHPDDIMNLHRALVELRGARGIIANILRFTTVYRPLGGVYYLTIYAIGGLDPFAFRIVTFILMIVNIGLVFLLIRSLTQNTEAAALGALIWSYHPRLVDLYANNGTIYDVLSVMFFVSALIIYVQARHNGNDLSIRAAAAYLIFYVASINSKEIGVTLPVITIFYEVVYNRRELRESPPYRAIVCLCVALVLATGATIVKSGEQSAFHGIPAYEQRLSGEQFLRNQVHFLGELLLQEEGNTSTSELIASWSLLGFGALLFRKRALLFAFGYILVTPLPVSFITTRNFFALYLTYAGWALYASCAIILARDFIWRQMIWLMPNAAASSLQRMLPTGTFAVAIVCLCFWHSGDPYVFPILTPDEERLPIRLTLAELQRLRPCPDAESIGKGHRILFVNDRWGPGNYNAILLTRLVCHNPDLEVDLGWRLAAANPSVEPALYDYVLEYHQDRLYVKRNVAVRPPESGSAAHSSDGQP
ncbi:MAG: glycosyltransferase family 39 protein [Bryobacterales bacterium]|nr:glycosyltransferase family 39 protein [Bryobacterales bacterium]